jgi:hypothetical protein
MLDPELIEYTSELFCDDNEDVNVIGEKFGD